MDPVDSPRAIPAGPDASRGLPDVSAEFARENPGKSCKGFRTNADLVQIGPSLEAPTSFCDHSSLHVFKARPPAHEQAAVDPSSTSAASTADVPASQQASESKARQRHKLVAAMRILLLRRRANE